MTISERAAVLYQLAKYEEELDAEVTRLTALYMARRLSANETLDKVRATISKRDAIRAGRIVVEECAR